MLSEAIRTFKLSNVVISNLFGTIDIHERQVQISKVLLAHFTNRRYITLAHHHRFQIRVTSSQLVPTSVTLVRRSRILYCVFHVRQSFAE